MASAASAFSPSLDGLVLAELQLLQARSLGERKVLLGALVGGGIVGGCVAGVEGWARAGGTGEALEAVAAALGE